MSLGHTIALAAAPILAVAKVSTGVIIAKSVALGTLAAGAIAVIRNRREFGRIAQMDAAQLRDIGLTPATSTTPRDCRSPGPDPGPGAPGRRASAARSPFLDLRGITP